MSIVGRWGRNYSDGQWAADIASINSFIADEKSDVKKYSYAATTLKNPEAKKLSLQLATEEMKHATRWEDLKAKLEAAQTSISYSDFFDLVQALEKLLANLPEVSLMGTQYFPLMLSRPICIAKELLRAVIKKNLDMLVDNPHILKEIELLQKDMENLKHDLKFARVRGERVQWP